MPSPNTPNTPYYTDAQWQQLLGLSDIGAKEQRIAQQRALAEQLRGSGGTRMDWASQASRGLGGIGSAMMNYKAMQGQGQLGDERTKWLEQVRRAQMMQGAQPQNVPPQQPQQPDY